MTDLNTPEAGRLTELRHRLESELRQLHDREDRAARNNDSETALRLIAEIVGLKKALTITEEMIASRTDVLATSLTNKTGPSPSAKR